MATVTTKFGIGDTCYTFDPTVGEIKPHGVIGILTKAVSGTSTPAVSYMTSNRHEPLCESDCMTAKEVTDVGNAWIAAKSVSMFTSAGL